MLQKKIFLVFALYTLYIAILNHNKLSFTLFKSEVSAIIHDLEECMMSSGYNNYCVLLLATPSVFGGLSMIIKTMQGFYKSHRNNTKIVSNYNMF